MRKRLSKSEIKALNEHIPTQFDKKDPLEIIDNTYYVLNNECVYFKRDDVLIPSLKLLLRNPDILPEVIVDMGAVRFVANGADIMRPGILIFPEVAEGTIVCIKDVNNKKPLAIGKTMLSKEAFETQTSGKSVQNIHFIGDELWKQY